MENVPVTEPRLLTRSVLLDPEFPMFSPPFMYGPPFIFHREPSPATETKLPTPKDPISPLLEAAKPPSSTTSWLNEPEFPTCRPPKLDHPDPAPTMKTRLLLALDPIPMQ